MKAISCTLRLFAWSVSACLALASESRAFKLEASVDYPVGVGTSAQNFNPNLGFTGKLYLAPKIDPAIKNYLSFSYQNLSLKTESNSSFRVFPILAGLEMDGKVFEGFHATFGGGIGLAMAYLNSRSATLFRNYGYFAAQLHGGLEYDVAPGFSAFFRLPITYMVSSATMSFLTYSVGANYEL